MNNSLKSALGNREGFHTYKGREYRLEEFDVNDVADIEEQLGDLSKLDPTKPAHVRLILWIVMRRNDAMLTPDEIRDCRYRMRLKDVGSLLKASDLRLSVDGDGLLNPSSPGLATIQFVAAIMKASGLYGDGDDAGEKKESPEPVEPSATGETSLPS